MAFLQATIELPLTDENGSEIHRPFPISFLCFKESDRMRCNFEKFEIYAFIPDFAEHRIMRLADLNDYARELFMWLTYTPGNTPGSAPVEEVKATLDGMKLHKGFYEVSGLMFTKLAEENEESEYGTYGIDMTGTLRIHTDENEYREALSQIEESRAILEAGYESGYSALNEEDLSRLMGEAV